MAGLRQRNASMTRQRIVAAADAEFTERGFRDATMEAIAARAGVSLRTLYNFFPRKTVLYLHDFSFHVGVIEAVRAAPVNVSVMSAIVTHLATGIAKLDTEENVSVVRSTCSCGKDWRKSWP